MSWSVLVTTTANATKVITQPALGDWIESATKREVFDSGKAAMVTADVYQRDALQPGQRLHGPAIVQEDGTSTVVSASFDAYVDPDEALILVAKEANS